MFTQDDEKAEYDTLSSMTTSLSAHTYASEADCVEALSGVLSWPEERKKRIHEKAVDLVRRVRGQKQKGGTLEAFLQQYGLDTEEGRSLMTLAEALLRIPDTPTAMALIRDKVGVVNWLAAESESSSGNALMKAAGAGLALTRKTLESGLLSKLGEPVIYKSMLKAMRILGKQFVLGRTIEEGIEHAGSWEKKDYRFSYDMLGEGARTAEDAERYFEAYKHALKVMGGHPDGGGLSVKLSALHPRYEYAQKDICLPVLTEKLTNLALQAAQQNTALTVDAEEVERLELSLPIIESVMRHPDLKDWDGFGLAVQAYQKRAFPLIGHLTALGEKTGKRLQVRLVKGAYWDTEIRRAQLLGLPAYPVFTRKVNTDLSYLACAQLLLERRDVFTPLFATHNAHTIAAVMELAGEETSGFHFQRLHGMGESLYEVFKIDHPAIPVTIYAPCGSHEDLLPYLVRRLLENGANSAFVKKLHDAKSPAEEIVADPVEDACTHASKTHLSIPLPGDLYGAQF